MTLNDLFVNAHVLPHLPACLATGQPCYLVGGALRDFLLGRPTADFDFATPYDPTKLARLFATRIGGRWFMMDRARKQSRVVLKGREGQYTYDFAPFRSDSLEGDLRLRDFTINALAVEISGDITAEDLLDPLDARSDLNHSILRVCSVEAFKDDPLRLLRGIRLAALLKMDFDRKTYDLMAAETFGLDRVSAERIRNELSMILAVDCPSDALQRMLDLGLLTQIFGLPGPGGSFPQGIRNVTEVSRQLPLYDSMPRLSLGQVVPEPPLSAAGMIRLAAFLAGTRSLETRPQLLKELRFSNRSDLLIRGLTGLGSSQVDELLALNSPGRGRALWVSRLGAVPGLSLIYLLCRGDHPGSLVDPARDAFDDYLKHLNNGRVPDLVDGSWIRSELGVRQGRQVGRYLYQLRMAEIEGRVHSLEEGHKLLKSLVQKTIDKKNDPS